MFTRWTQVHKKLSSVQFERVRSCHAPVQISSVNTRYLQIIDNLATNHNHPWTFERKIHAQGLILKILIQQSWGLDMNIFKKVTRDASLNSHNYSRHISPSSNTSPRVVSHKLSLSLCSCHPVSHWELGWVAATQVAAQMSLSIHSCLTLPDTQKRQRKES